MTYLKNFTKLIYKKKKILKCIFTTLLLQVIITSLVFIWIFKSNVLQQSINIPPSLHSKRGISGYMLVSFIVLIIGLIISMTSLNITFNSRLVIFSLLSVVEGIFLGLCLNYLDVNIILIALLSCICLFVSMIIIGFGLVYFNLDLSWIGLSLYVTLLALLITRIVNLFTPFTSIFNNILAIISIILFSVYIIFDTNVILMRYNNANYDIDCITGALYYYLDILNIFVNMISSN